MLTDRQSPMRAIERAANLVFASGLGVCVIGLLYISYHYYWRGTREFSNVWMGWGVVSTLALTGGLFAVGLRTKMPLKGNLALSVGSIGASIYAMEIVLSIWSSLPSVQEDQYRRLLAAAAAEHGVNFDARTKAQVVHDWRQDGLDPVVSMFPHGLITQQEEGALRSAIRSHDAELLPLGGISRSRTVLCNENGDYVGYASDEHGFHNPLNLWQRTPVDVVVLGDSFAQGWCVPSGRDFASLIRGRYPVTLNLGIEGDGPLTMLATMKEYARILGPKLTLWCFFEGNDLADLLTERRSPLLRGYLTDGFTQDLATRQGEIDQALRAYMDRFMETSSLRVRLREAVRVAATPADAGARLASIVKLSALRARAGVVTNASSAPSSSDARERRAQSLVDLFASFRETLAEAKRFTEQSGGRMYFVYLPSRDRYYSQGAGPSPDRERVLEIVREVGLPLIDVHPAFAKQGDALALFPFRYAAHYNEQGHRLVAETILARLAE